VLECGDVLQLSLGEQQGGFSVSVEALQGALIGVDAEGRALHAGSEVLLQLVIPGDARYGVGARVDSIREELTFLCLTSRWKRVQHREFFRVAVDGLGASLVRRDARAAVRRPLPASVIDLSAGGVQVETRVTLLVGDRVWLRLALPGISPLELEGSVVRTTDATGAHRAGVSFIAVQPELRTRLLQWIYALQAQRRSLELDAAHW
jgi:c-di-GMP-binding flagellar brake protein YcgR